MDLIDEVRKFAQIVKKKNASAKMLWANDISNFPWKLNEVGRYKSSWCRIIGFLPALKSNENRRHVSRSGLVCLSGKQESMLLPFRRWFSWPRMVTAFQSAGCVTPL